MKHVKLVAAAVYAAFMVFVVSAAAGNWRGGLDDTFGTGGVATTVIGSNSSGLDDVALQSDGKIIAFGQSDYAPAKTGFTLARYLDDGALDPSFGTAGIVTTEIEPPLSEAQAGLVQPDGKIVAAGYTAIGGDENNTAFAVVRYLANGQLDNSFGTGGIAEIPVGPADGAESVDAVAIQPDGKLLVTGHAFYNPGSGAAAGIALVRLTALGQLDATFGTGGVVLTRISDASNVPIGAGGRAIVILSSGEIVIPYSNTVGDGLDAVAYTAVGQVDTTWGHQGFFHYALSSANGSKFETTTGTLLANGSIIIAGNDVPPVSAGFIDNFNAVAITPTGAVDTATLSPSGFIRMSNDASVDWVPGATSSRSGLERVLEDAAGRLLFVGWVGPSGAHRFQLIRWDRSAGYFDESFGCNGVANPPLGGTDKSWAATGAALDAQGRIVVGGTVVTSQTTSDFAVARYLADGPTGQCTPAPTGGGTGGGGSSGGGGSGGGGGSSGGGSGGGGVPNLAVQIVQGQSEVPVGGNVVYTIFVSNNGSQSSHQTHLVIKLPDGATLVGPPYYEIGSGCTGTTTVDCLLDYIPAGGSTRVAFQLVAATAGLQTLTATASADLETDLSDNTASSTLQVGSPPVATSPAAPPPAAPVRAPLGRTLSGGPKPDNLTGTRYADKLNGGGGNDRLRGGAGNDVLNGGAGNDVLDGGPGADQILGGTGNDTILARDGTRDTISCGPGRDVASVDKFDRVTGCEVVRRA